MLQSVGEKSSWSSAVLGFTHRALQWVRSPVAVPTSPAHSGGPSSALLRIMGRLLTAEGGERGVYYRQEYTTTFTNNLPIERGEDFLDFGTGTGVVALFATEQGAGSVFALDNDAESVELAASNVRQLGLSDKIQVVRSEGFANVPRGRKFDHIAFFAPVPGGEGLSRNDGRRYDPTYQILEMFLKGSAQHLAPGGKITLMYPDNPSSLVKLQKLSKKYNLVITLRKKISDDQALIDECQRGFHPRVYQLSQRSTCTADELREELSKSGTWTWSVYTLVLKQRPVLSAEVPRR